MPQSSREVVRRALEFDYPDRIPVELWTLPWFIEHHPREYAALAGEFPNDIVTLPLRQRQGKRVAGDPYFSATYTDEWGCVFENLLPGAIGEVKEPVMKEAGELDKITPPWEILPTGEERAAVLDEISRYCRSEERFVLAPACPRLWERYQFLRGTAEAMMDVLLEPEAFKAALDKIHDYYCAELEFWGATAVDALQFMDDWGTQRSLLIDPAVWRELIKPYYAEYREIARRHGKYLLMHSDGCISAIYPDLVELEIDAINSQLACMNLDELAGCAKGKVTFRGEIDRQQVLTADDPEVGRREVRRIAEKLYTPAGGIICNFELGLGANPATCRAVCEEWRNIGRSGK